MPVYVAFLRAINVGGRNSVSMAELRRMTEDLGFGVVQTLLQSGNLMFESKSSDARSLENLLEKETKKRFGVAVDYMVRTKEQMSRVVRENPFKNEAQEDPGHLVVLFLKEEPPKSAEKELQDAIKGIEIVRVCGREAYVTYPDGIGRSKLTNAIIEKKLGTRATGRNWNTVLKLHDLLSYASS